MARDCTLSTSTTAARIEIQNTPNNHSMPITSLHSTTERRNTLFTVQRCVHTDLYSTASAVLCANSFRETENKSGWTCEIEFPHELNLQSEITLEFLSAMGFIGVAMHHRWNTFDGAHTQRTHKPSTNGGVCCCGRPLFRSYSDCKSIIDLVQFIFRYAGVPHQSRSSYQGKRIIFCAGKAADGRHTHIFVQFAHMLI